MKTKNLWVKGQMFIDCCYGSWGFTKLMDTDYNHYRLLTSKNYDLSSNELGFHNEP